jgi:hypothetical protein
MVADKNGALTGGVGLLRSISMTTSKRKPLASFVTAVAASETRRNVHGSIEIECAVLIVLSKKSTFF